MWSTGTLIHYWRECKLEHPLWSTVWLFLTKLTHAYYSATNTTPRYLPKMIENIRPHKDAYVKVYSSLFTIDPNWNTPTIHQCERVNCGSLTQRDTTYQ